MKITCPKCHTSYTLDDSLIPAGGSVKVQCPSCQARYRVKKKAAKKETITSTEQAAPSVTESPEPSVQTPPSTSLQKPPAEPANKTDAASSTVDDLFSQSHSAVAEESDLDSLFGDNQTTTGDLFEDNDDNPFGASEPDQSQKQEPQQKEEHVDNLSGTENNSDDNSSGDADELFSDISSNEEESADSTEDLFADIGSESSDKIALDSGRFDDEPFDDPFADMDDGGIELDNPLNLPTDEETQIKTMVSGLGLQDSDSDDSDNADDLFSDIKDEQTMPADDTNTIFSDASVEALEKTMIIDGNEVKETQSATPKPHHIHVNSASMMGSDSQNDTTSGELFSDVSFDMFDKPAGDGDLFSTIAELPDDDAKEQSPETKTQTKKHRGDKTYYVLLALKSGAALLIVSLLAFGGYRWYVSYHAGKSTDVLKQISESITESTGTLSDVRHYLQEDSVNGYKKAFGILKQYMNSEEIAPSVIGLDALIKLNALYSYNQRMEALTNIQRRLTDALKQNPDNNDILKANAFLDVFLKQYDEAAKLLQGLAKEKDTESLYILGVTAYEQKRYLDAHKLLAASFISSKGKSSKAAFMIAKANYAIDNIKTSIAYLNKIIKKHPDYLRAYLLKADILVKKMGKRRTALALLKGIDPASLSVLSKRDQASYYSMLAHLYYINGNTKKAGKNYDQAISLMPRDIHYLLTAADFLRKTGDAAKAIKYYDRAISIEPHNVNAIIGRAETNAELGNSGKVRSGLFRIDLAKLKDAKALTRIGKLLAGLGTEIDMVEATKYLDAAIQADPSYIEPYLSKIFILISQTNIEAARTLVAKLQKLKASSYQYHLARGIILHRDGDYDKAHSEFKLAVKMNTEGDIRVYYYYGSFLFDLAETERNSNKARALTYYKQAISYLRKSYKASRDTFDYRITLGKALYAVGRYKEVISVLKREKYEEQQEYKALQLLADAAYNLKRYDEALTYAKRGMELYSKSVRLFTTKAKILYAMKDFHAAQKAVETALLVNMGDFESYLLYSQILIAEGDFKSAMEKINTAEKSNPNDPRLSLLKGVIAKNLDDYYTALKYFKKIRKHPKLQKQAYEEIAECYRALGKMSKALKYFKKAAAQGDIRAMVFLGDIYYDKGELKRAVKYYRRSYAHDKKNPEVLKRLAYIYKENEEYVQSLAFFNRYRKLLGDDADPVEEEMIDDEIYFLRENMPKQKFKEMVEHPEAYNDEGISKATIAKAKKMYMKARAIRKSDPQEAKRLFREVMTLVPKTNRYYRKAFKQFSKIK